jgi:hypothetical protein
MPELKYLLPEPLKWLINLVEKVPFLFIQLDENIHEFDKESSSLEIHKYDSQYRAIKNSPGIGGLLIFTW